MARAGQISTELSTSVGCYRRNTGVSVVDDATDKMKRRFAIGICSLVIAAVAVVSLRSCRSGVSRNPSASSKAATSITSTRPDPRTQSRASISGRVTDEQGAPAPGARVCADGWANALPRALTREPRCTVADAGGAYTISNLFAAEYAVSAMAKPYRPALFLPKGKEETAFFELHAGEKKSGVDLVLREGGVEISGTVSDLTGGPIAHASVRAVPDGVAGPVVETDDQGRFSIWVAPGNVDVNASADGYASGYERGVAPGTFEVMLTPESSISGTVVDAKTNAPVAGIAVDVSRNLRIDSFGPPGDISDENGRFRIDGLTPDRYMVIAREPRMFGSSEGTTLVGLGQEVAGVIVKLSPTARVEGKIMIAGSPSRPCNDPAMWITPTGQSDSLGARGEPDGTVRIDSVLPGRYAVNVGCKGYVALEKYPPLEVKDTDVAGLRWEVVEGGVIRGRVMNRSGEPIEGATVRTYGAEADVSKKDGSYELKAVTAGKHTLVVTSKKGVAATTGYDVEVTGRAVVQKDLVLEESGTARGVVVDADGKPVGGASVSIRPVAAWDVNTWMATDHGSERTRDDGTFIVERLPTGDYRVSVALAGTELRLQGLKGDAPQEMHVNVRAPQTTTLRVVVEKRTGTIRGIVSDGAGKPVTDAYVVAARESTDSKSNIEATRWLDYDKPVITGVDGSFAFAKLAEGSYTVSTCWGRIDRPVGVCSTHHLALRFGLACYVVWS